MKKPIDYYLVERPTWNDFVNHVNEMILEEYHPIGGVSRANIPEKGEECYMQAMVKYES